MCRLCYKHFNSKLQTVSTDKVASSVCCTCNTLFAHTSNFNLSSSQGDGKDFDLPDKVKKSQKSHHSLCGTEKLTKLHHLFVSQGKYCLRILQTSIKVPYRVVQKVLTIEINFGKPQKILHFYTKQ